MRTLARLPGGARWRTAYPSENAWFAENLVVAGFAIRAAELVLNPYLRRQPRQRRSVLLNEAVRIYLWRKPAPRIWLTLQQRRRFTGYGQLRDQGDTVLARLVARDPSAGTPSAQQKKVASGIMDRMRVAPRTTVWKGLLAFTIRARWVPRDAVAAAAKLTRAPVET